MRSRQPLPRRWLMTDERQGDRLWTALQRLPARSGVVFRHYSLQPGERRQLFRRVRSIARRRGHMLLLAGPPALGRAWGADGCHGRWRKPPGLILSAPAHDGVEIRAAERAGADLVFVSPVFPTRSHPGAAPLGPRRLGRLARRTRLPVIALGGMDAERARRLAGVHGWAAIDAWTV